MTEYKHDWIAQTAPAGVMGFFLDRDWALSANFPLRAAVVKVTLFDVQPGVVRLTQAFLNPLVEVDDGGSSAPYEEGASSNSSGARWRYGNATGRLWAHPNGTRYPQVGQTLTLAGDGQLKTLTFVADALPVREPASRRTHAFDFELHATNLKGTLAVPLCVSMVRIIKLGRAKDAASGGAATGKQTSDAAAFFSCCDPRGVVTVIVIFSLMGAFFCFLYVRQVLHTRFAFSKRGAEEQGVAAVQPWSSVPAPVTTATTTSWAGAAGERL